MKRRTPHLLPSAPSQACWLPVPSNYSRTTSRRRSIYSWSGTGPSCLLSTRSLRGEAEELESDEVNETVPPIDEHGGEVESDEVLDGVITSVLSRS